MQNIKRRFSIFLAKTYFPNKFCLKFAFIGDFYSPGKTLKSFPRASRGQQQNSSKTHKKYKWEKTKLIPNTKKSIKKDVMEYSIHLQSLPNKLKMWKLSFCCSDFWFFLPQLITVIHRRWIVKCCISRDGKSSKRGKLCLCYFSPSCANFGAVYAQNMLVLVIQLRLSPVQKRHKRCR